MSTPRSQTAPHGHSTGDPRPAARWRLIVWVLVLIALSYFVLRGPIRNMQGDAHDFRVLWAGGAAWLQGDNPYGMERLADLVVERGFPERPAPYGMPQITTPLLFPFLAPLGLFTWPIAKAIWLALNIGMVFGIAETLRRAGGFLRGGWQWPLFLALLLASGPFHTTIANGQVSILSTFLIALALLASIRRADTTAGGLIAASFCVKPTMAALYGLDLLVRRRWIGVASGIIVGAAIAGIAIGWLEWLQLPWLEAWRDNYQRGVEGMNSIASGERSAITMFHLDVVLIMFGLDVSSARQITLALAVVAIGLWAWVSHRSRRNDDGGSILLSWSVLSILTLLTVYHRYYDATLLVFPLAWSLTAINGPQRASAIGFLILMMPFLAPIPAALDVWHERGFLPTAVHESWAWQTLVIRHQTWALLAMLALLFHAACRSRHKGDLP